MRPVYYETSSKCYSQEIGEALFNPTLVKIDWENAPSDDGHEFWFPYRVSIKGREKYGQYAPMMGESSLLELLGDAIMQDSFSDSFLNELQNVISHKQALGQEELL